MTSSQPITTVVTKEEEEFIDDQEPEFSNPSGQNTRNKKPEPLFDRKTVGNPKSWHWVFSELYYHAKLGLCLYNYLENMNFEFVELNTASMELMAYTFNYMTFKAFNPATGLTGFFRVFSETNVHRNGEDDNIRVNYCRLEATSIDGESESNSQVGKRRKIKKEFVDIGSIGEYFMECVPSGSSRNKFLGFNECPMYIEKVQELKAEGCNVGNVELLPDHWKESKDIEWLRVCAQLALYNKWQNHEGRFELMAIDKIHVQTEGVKSEVPLVLSNKANFYMTFKAKELEKDSTATFHTVVRRLIRDEQGEMWIQMKCSKLEESC